MTRSDRRGFTLIELLVVMAIISVLAGLGVTAAIYMSRRGPKTAAQTYLTTLAASLDAYKSSQGAYPPTSLADFPGVGNLQNQENLGIESVVICLASKRYPGSFDFGDTPGGKLENEDGDYTQVNLTRFDAKDMFEVVDPWGTPYAYFNAQSYANFEALGKITGVDAKVQPYKDPKTKSWRRYDSFQLISAGPDHLFNTEDDITNFERE